MNVHELTTQNFNSLIDRAWNRRHRLVGLVVSAVPRVRAGLRGRGRAATRPVFAKIDANAQHGLAAAFHIRALPTLMIFRDGILLFRDPAMLSTRGVDCLLVDMGELRRRLESRMGGCGAIRGGVSRSTDHSATMEGKSR